MSIYPTRFTGAFWTWIYARQRSGGWCAVPEARGEILPAEESLIIATARVNGFSLLTRRAAYHRRLGVNVIDPYLRAAQ